MNIVIITIILPYPLNSGGAQAQYNFIDQLRSKHHITILFPENGMNSMQAMNVLKQRWPEVNFRPYRFFRQLLYLPFLWSKIKRAFNLRFMSKNARFQVERILKPYGYPMHDDFVNFVRKTIDEQQADIVQIEFYPYLHFVHKLPNDIKKIFIHHELRYVRNKRLLANIQLTAKEKKYMNDLQLLEIADLNSYDKVVTLTGTDKQELIYMGVKVPIIVSPASINTQIVPYRGWNGKILFLGGFGHTPNEEGMEWFLDEVVPLIDWGGMPRAELDIVGSEWPRYFEQRTSLIKVICHGFVENIADVACGAIMIVPILSGSGMRMKILEAAALGLPMLTTSVGVEGLSFSNEESCMIADTPEKYAEALSRLMSDEALRRKLTANAIATFEEKYSVAALASQRDIVYTE